MRARYCWLLACVDGLDFFGYSGRKYQSGERVPIEVTKLWSAKSQVPYSYYDLNVCRPDVIEKQTDGFGGMWLGEVRESTAYEAEFMGPPTCKVLCKKEYGTADLRALERKIDDEYYVNLLADGLQGSIRMKALDYLKYFDALQYWSADLMPDEESKATDSVLVAGGYPIGLHLNKDIPTAGPGSTTDPGHASFDENKYILFNHLDMVIRYNNNAVVEFEITPYSRDWTEATACRGDTFMLESGWSTSPDAPSNKTVFYTYSVSHGDSNIDFATRWDAYMSAVSGSTETHMTGIINGFNLTILLAVITLIILARTLRRDLMIYNNTTSSAAAMGLEIGDIESLRRETGWKLLHGDIFRKPRFAKLMACFLGLGVQLIIMMFITLTLSQIGFMSPTKRGFIMQTAMVLFFLLGIPAGYVSARFNRLMQPNYDKTILVALYTSCIYSGICVAVIFFNSLVLYCLKSPAALSASAIITLLILWLLICLPLVFIGSFIGYRTPDMDLPCKTNLIPRMVPELPWYLRSYVLCPIGGLIPFSTTFGEFMMVANSVWQHKLYFLFGVLFAICVLLVVTSALISIIFTYSCISHENHRWWWRSWWSAGFSGIYMFIAFTLYYFIVLDLRDLTSTFMYFSYSALVAYTITLVTGASGTLASFWFLKKIYAAIKLE